MNLVPLEKVADVFPFISEWLRHAVEHGPGDENLWDVFVAIAQGRYMLWHEPTKFAAVVQVQNHPRQKVAVIVYLGGEDLDVMRTLWPEAKAWCKANGITVLRTYGREGWQRVLDLKPVGTVLQVSV